MTKFRMLILPLALYIWAGTTLLFVNYQRDAFSNLQEYKLDLIVNYAADAAVEEMVDSSPHLQTDYTKFDYVSCDPEVALNMFCTIFLKGYNMVLSDENYAAVKANYLPVFCVAAYDGYYIGEPTKINNASATDLIFQPKAPYLYRDGANLYALNLSMKEAKKFNNRTLAIVDNLPISEIEQKVIINQVVSDALMETVYRQKDKQVLSTIYLPSRLTNISNTNPIENVTVFAYVSNIPAGNSNKIETFGIGGARIKHERFVAAYKVGEEKLYCYTDALNKIGVSINSVIKIYENPMLAAAEGYYFDMRYYE